MDRGMDETPTIEEMSKALLEYLIVGDIENACQTVIYASQVHGIKCLPSCTSLDMKTSHIIRAGLAASRMIAEGGDATIFISDEYIKSKTHLRLVSDES